MGQMLEIYIPPLVISSVENYGNDPINSPIRTKRSQREANFPKDNLIGRKKY